MDVSATHYRLNFRRQLYSTNIDKDMGHEHATSYTLRRTYRSTTTRHDSIILLHYSVSGPATTTTYQHSQNTLHDYADTTRPVEHCTIQYPLTTHVIVFTFVLPRLGTTHRLSSRFSTQYEQQPHPTGRVLDSSLTNIHDVLMSGSYRLSGFSSLHFPLFDDMLCHQTERS